MPPIANSIHRIERTRKEDDVLMAERRWIPVITTDGNRVHQNVSQREQIGDLFGDTRQRRAVGRRTVPTRERRLPDESTGSLGRDQHR